MSKGDAQESSIQKGKHRPGGDFHREPTRREIEVIRRVAEGYKNREVAEEWVFQLKWSRSTGPIS